MPKYDNILKNIFLFLDSLFSGVFSTLGTGKILTVLFLDARHHFLNKDVAPTLQDVNYAAVAVADSWTGETVADFLRKIIKIIGKPVAYLKDGGTELAIGGCDIHLM